jgi:hypothetical protein
MGKGFNNDACLAIPADEWGIKPETEKVKKVAVLVILHLTMPILKK